MHGYTGTHDELLMNLDGAYSQLIQIQESPKETEQKLDRHISNRSRSLSSSELIGRSSVGNSSRHSFTLPLALPSSIVELYEANDDTNDNEKDKAGDSEAPKQSPLGRLANLNKPELPVILLGSLAAAIHGMLLPVSGVVISNAIITFFEPADKLKSDSQFWGLICIVLGIVSIISIPVEYFLFGIAGGKLIERVRALSFRSIVHQDVAWFDNPKNSRLVSIPLFTIFSFLQYL